MKCFFGFETNTPRVTATIACITLGVVVSLAASAAGLAVVLGRAVWNSGQLAALLVGGPVCGQVQRAADQGVREGDHDLAQVDAVEGAAVLAGRSGAVGGRFRVVGLIDDQHCVIPGLARGKVPGRPAHGEVEHLLIIDAGAGEQVLHPVRPRGPGGLREGPAVAAAQLCQQAANHVTAGHAGFPPGEAQRDPLHQITEQASVRVMVYRGTSGCRAIVLFRELA